MNIEHNLQQYPIYPICIPTPFAVGDVYSYLIKDEKIILVDCGHKSDEAYECVKHTMQCQGLTLSDLDEIWLTHGHPDHFGQACILAAQSRALVWGHPKERSDFACNKSQKLFESFFKVHDIPSDQITLMIEQLDWLQQFQEPVESGWVTEGEVLTSGSMNFRVKHTPGHAPGHLTFYSDTGIIFGGDILLEHISTNALINFDPDTQQRNKSLLQYRQSLKWIRELEGLILPGHGEFISNIRKVADHHLSEHEKRYEKIYHLLEEKSCSLYELALKLFADAMKKGAAFLVLSEVLGYLDWGMDEESIELNAEKFGISNGERNI